MLFRKSDWPGLASGAITVAFRQWKRPTVRTGGTLRTAAGMLAIDSVEVVEPTSIDDVWAERAGRANASSVVRDLGVLDPARRIYRVTFHHVGEDPRVALRVETDLGSEELQAALARLGRLDRAAPTPWTRAVLAIIADRPGVVSTELSKLVGQERAAFKVNVRKLKALGLTESLEVGYRISPRGEVVLRSLRSGDRGPRHR